MKTTMADNPEWDPNLDEVSDPRDRYCPVCGLYHPAAEDCTPWEDMAPATRILSSIFREYPDENEDD